MIKKRLIFIDCMKAIGMFAIILGHFFPSTIQYVTYAFSVQLFFVVSGFLFKRSVDKQTFWNKNIQGLIVPYFILGGVNWAFTTMRTLDVDTICCSSIGLCMGISNVDNHGGCGGLWFVVTLLLLKIVFQYLNLRKATMLILVMIPLIFVYRRSIIGRSFEFWGFSFCNIFIAYPFFLIGYLLSEFCYDKIFLFTSLLKKNIGFCH